MRSEKPLVEMRHITKTFGSIVANSDANLDIYSGEILAILGENGSGKTTLMNMLAGIYFPDSGHIFINGEEAVIASPKDAFSYGIGMIHQHFKLVNVLSAAENIALGLKDEGRFNIKKTVEKIKELCDRYGFELDPYEKIYNMSVSQKQTVEIIKALYRGADILILDEPTAVLTPQETGKLFNVLRNMKNEGKAVVIITHKMNEVEELSDRVVVLRKGKDVGSKLTKDTNAEEMSSMLVGHPVNLEIDHPVPEDPKPRIIVNHLTVRNMEGLLKLDNVSFTINSGEILGVAGISGNGQKELLEAIAGLQPTEEGSIRYIDDDGSEHELIGKDPLEIQNLGVSLSFVPEDRLGMGLVGSMDITNNMMLRSYRNGRSMFLDETKPRDLAGNVVDELEVKTPSLETPVRNLSGGNVQKVLVGREISSAPTVLLTAYAVRGLDINSSYMIYDLINKQKKQGVAVVYVGEDLDVLIELSDRILVLCDGKVSGILRGGEADKRRIGLMMTKLGGGTADE